jgi:carboxylate-amine ligase
MDAVSRSEDAIALAAFVQALAKLYADESGRGSLPPPAHSALIRENIWQATRYGLEATLIDLAGHLGSKVPVRSLVQSALQRVAGPARELGCERELEGIDRILRDGNGADRQSRVYAATNDLVAVAREIADLTIASTASRAPREAQPEPPR